MIKINDKSKCTGCNACVQICSKQCVSMKEDSEGFFYPEVDDNKCTKCGRCIKACPIITPVLNKKTEKDIIAYAAINIDDEIRAQSSSGGIFTLIATYIIEQGGVVFGAAFNNSFQVEHRYTETIEGLEVFRGSKYVQSQINNSYKQAKMFLKGGRLVLFTGTPCQIEGLYSYLGREYENLITQDIICHGVPSPLVWEKYKEYRLKFASSKISNVKFRCKNDGWKNFSILFEYKNGSNYVMSLLKDSYMLAFLNNWCLRLTCYNCPFKTKVRLSDFTLADFWGIEHVMPQMNDDKGTSLVLINSLKAKIVFDKIKGSIRYEQVDLDSALEFNSAMTKSVKLPVKRKKIMNTIRNNDFEIAEKKFLKTNKLSEFLKIVKRKVRKILTKKG